MDTYEEDARCCYCELSGCDGEECPCDGECHDGNGTCPVCESELDYLRMCPVCPSAPTLASAEWTVASHEEIDEARRARERTLPMVRAVKVAVRPAPRGWACVEGD